MDLKNFCAEFKRRKCLQGGGRVCRGGLAGGPDRIGNST